MIQEAEKYRSTANLNVRAGPSATAKALGKLAIDQVIEKVGESEDGKWIKFLFKDSEKHYPKTELLRYRIPK